MVVGRLGAGKTSLRNLVNDCITKRNTNSTIRVVTIELWPYATSTAAVDAIVHQLVEALEDYVNVTALRGLPAAYTDAMRSAGGLWSAGAHLQGIPRAPSDILRRIDNVATAIGIRLVLWVEDLERFCSSGFSRDDDADETPEEQARLSPIRALLHGLESLDSITVVTATTTLRKRFDLEKIARFIETLPELEDGSIARVLSRFRKGCRTIKEYIDPVPSDERKDLALLDDPERLVGRNSFLGPGVFELIDAILVLARTPRTLKQGLRRCLDIWEVLAGEIDFDELLTLCLLREASPDAFALVREWSAFQRIPESLRDRKVNARDEWDKKLKSLPLR